MKKRILTVVVGILCAVGMHGQSSGVPSLPQLATPSPKATMIDRFGYYPTNLYTGLVDITIPIHTIEVKGIKIPIEFKYHASGLKYDDLPMEVGYGWTLMAGGTVSYSARGAGLYPPNGISKSPFMKRETDIVKNDKTGAPDSDQLHLEYALNGSKSKYDHADYYCDSEYDMYNYSFPGHSGQYYLLSDGTYFTVPSTTARLDLAYNPVARDEYGNDYIFEVQDTDTYGRNFTSYLSRIVSADRKDTINFVYDQILLGAPDKVKRPVIDNTYIVKYDTNSGSATYQYGGTLGIFYKEFNTPILKEINYRGGKVAFLYSATSKRSLEKIEIRNQQNVIVQSVTLDKTNQSYLNAVNFRGKDNKNAYSYRFEYNGSKPEDALPIVDYWGYYTGFSTSSGLYVPNFSISVMGSDYRIPGMDRSPNETGMSKGILKKVVYPTQGYSLFTYEGHRADNKLYGGLRIKEVKNYDSNNNLLETKWYKYGQKEDGNGRAVQPVNSNDYVASSLQVESIYGGSSGSGPSVGTLTYIQAYDAFPKRSYYTLGSTVVYPYVTEYTGSSTGSYGKTEYYYTDYSDEYVGTIRGNASELPRRSNAWKCGKLISKTVKDSSGKTVYSLHNSYEAINSEEYLNLKVLPYAQITGSEGSSIEERFTNYSAFSSVIDGSLHDYYHYYISSGDYAVKESEERVNGVAKTIQYQYNEYGQVTEETMIDSENNKLITRYKYAQSTSPSNSVYAAMYRENMIGPVLEKEEYKGAMLLDKTVNEYKNWGDFIALQNVKQLNYYEPRIKYQSYDKYGNPTRISKDGEFEDVSYIWGYKGQRVVAEIRGGSFSALGQTLIDRVTSAVSPSSADMAAIEALRNNHSLDGSRITTYYYDSALNLEQLVMPNGTKTNYEYDSFGRLSCVKDHNGKVIESYQYNYKQ